MSDLLAVAARVTVEYCRISRDRNGFAEGVESQHLDNEEAAEELGETISRTYTDNDLSAFSGVERPAYQELLRAIAAGKIKLIIFWHAKRLHRNVEEASTFLRLARSHKVKLYSYSHGWYNLDRVQGRQTFLQHTLDGQGESGERGERVALARKRQARQGVYGGGVRPYGWGVDTGRFRSVCINSRRRQSRRPAGARMRPGGRSRPGSSPQPLLNHLLPFRHAMRALPYFAPLSTRVGSASGAG